MHSLPKHSGKRWAVPTLCSEEVEGRHGSMLSRWNHGLSLHSNWKKERKKIKGIYFGCWEDVKYSNLFNKFTASLYLKVISKFGKWYLDVDENSNSLYSPRGNIMVWVVSLIKLMAAKHMAGKFILVIRTTEAFPFLLSVPKTAAVQTIMRQVVFAKGSHSDCSGSDNVLKNVFTISQTFDKCIKTIDHKFRSWNSPVDVAGTVSSQKMPNLVRKPRCTNCVYSPASLQRSCVPSEFKFWFFFLRDFIFKKTLFEKLQYLKQGIQYLKQGILN